MKLPSTGDLYGFAWRNVHKLPDGFVHAVANLAADATWLIHTGAVRQLESNLARLRPGLDARALRRLSRAGMRSYLRYFAEAFQLPGWSHEQIDARVRVVGADAVRESMANDGGVTLALGHAGNWDLAGAWASRHIGPVLTVAEQLPDGQFEEFVKFRASLGIEIVPLAGSGTFRTLLRKARSAPQVVPLLADRDLTAHGIEVEVAGLPARVAAGPAALCLTAKLPMFATVITYERLTGARKRAAGTRWGLVLQFIPVPRHTDDGERHSVESLTQAWVTTYFEELAKHPQDWHMLQKVFLADLDPERLARAKARAAGEE